jgi:PKD repeat protein
MKQICLSILLILLFGCVPSTSIPTIDVQLAIQQTLTANPTEISIPTILPSITLLPTSTPTKTPFPINATIYPNLENAKEEGFHLLAGQPPFTVDFYSEVTGGNGELTFAWDFDGDEIIDSTSIDPEPFTFIESGEYIVSFLVKDTVEQEESVTQRVVVIGEPEWPDWRFGLVSHLSWIPHFYQDRSEVSQAAKFIGELGVDVVRPDFNWSEIQPSGPNQYRWEDYDFIVDLSKKHDFDLFPILAYSSNWASTEEGASDWQTWYFSPPDIQEYAWFVFQAANRYKSDIKAWQIWNEQNNSFFWRPEPDVKYYTELLTQASLAIKYADPSAVVAIGGLSNSDEFGDAPHLSFGPERFLQGLYEHGGGRYFDVVARHPYSWPGFGAYKVIEKLKSIRSIMENNGDANKPIWVTEYGWSNVPTGDISKESQASWLNVSLNEIFSYDPNIVVIWYNLRDRGIEPDNYEHHMGLIDFDWRLKPAYNSYLDFITNYED